MSAANLVEKVRDGLAKVQEAIHYDDCGSVWHSGQCERIMDAARKALREIVEAMPCACYDRQDEQYIPPGTHHEWCSQHAALAVIDGRGK